MKTRTEIEAAMCELEQLAIAFRQKRRPADVVNELLCDVLRDALAWTISSRGASNHEKRMRSFRQDVGRAPLTREAAIHG